MAIPDQVAEPGRRKPPAANYGIAMPHMMRLMVPPARSGSSAEVMDVPFLWWARDRAGYQPSSARRHCISSLLRYLRSLRRVAAISLTRAPR